MTTEDRVESSDQEQFLRELIATGLLIEAGAPGVYGHGQVFERIRAGFAALITTEARAAGAISLTFPPVVSRHNLEATGYPGNFPHLTGSIFGFAGSEADAAVMRERASNHEDWSEFEAQTELMMLPAGCYPVYPAIAARGPLGPGGVLVDIGPSWVFRNEPSLDPARRQSFRMHELVRIGEPGVVAGWREEWSQRSVELLCGLGLDARLEGASDPFFGRAGRLLAANQSAEDLKWELMVPIAGPEPTACASFNYHQDHFAEIWGLKGEDGSVAHTACVGFGQERIVAALLRAHGLDPERWPAEVAVRLCEALGASSPSAAFAWLSGTADR